MLDSRQILALEQRLEEAHDELSRDWDRQGMSRVAAHDTLDRIEGLLADLDEMREAKVYERPSDEDYMDSYDEGLYKADDDEPYMDNFSGESEDFSEMMEEFGDRGHQRVEEAQQTDEFRYDEEEPHEHYREDEPDYHVDDDTGVNEDLQDRFGELCEDCRREARAKKKVAGKKVEDWKVEKRGVMTPGHFRGCGTSHTDWEEAATGNGYTYYEAVESALEFLAQGGWDVSGLRNDFDDRKTVDDALKEEMGPEEYEREYGGEMMGGPQPYFYVCVYVK